MEKEKSCGAVVFCQEDVLLVRMRQGHWSFPKGHVELEETETMTTVREVKEETDIDIEVIPGFREEIKYIVNQTSIKTVIFFIAIAKNQKFSKQEAEIMDIGWFSFETAKKLLTFDSDRKVLERAATFKKDRKI